MSSHVDFHFFRELLRSLENQQTSIRVRRLGESWTPFSRLILLSDSAMILQDSNERKIIVNVRSIMEFELDQPVEGFAANSRYEIEY